MGTVLSISAFVFAAYIASIIAFQGVPASISDSFYILDRKKKGAGYIFTLWCYAVGFTVMGIMFVFSDGKWYQFLGLFAGGGLCFVGTAPLFKSHERLIHHVSAATCAVSASLWMVFSGYGWLLAAASVIASAVMRKYKNHMFWAEAALFVSMYVALFIKIYLKNGNV